MENTGERFIPLQMSGQIAAEHLNRYQFVSRIIPLEGKMVLDIASGTGYGSNILAEKSKFVYGVDISKEAVEYASSNYAESNISFIQGDCCAIPLPDHSVDVVVSFETIEHIVDHEKFFSEIERVIRPEGILVISSPNKKVYSDTPDFQNPYHVSELYNEEFLSLVKKHFSNVEYYGQNYLFSSFIYPIASNSQWNFPIRYEESERGIIEPMYNIVIASNRPSSVQKPLALFYPDSQTIPNLCAEAYKEGYSSCQNSKSWKLGHFLLSPMRRIKEWLSNR